jgi:hypothetical protein
MSSTKKGNDWFFGMKAHVGVDAQSGIVHSRNQTPPLSAPSPQKPSRAAYKGQTKIAP